MHFIVFIQIQGYGQFQSGIVVFQVTVQKGTDPVYPLDHGIPVDVEKLCRMGNIKVVFCQHGKGVQ